MIEISIDASTSKCGIAIFEHGELSSYQTAEFEGTWSQQKLLKIIEYFDDLFTTFHPSKVFIEEPLVFAKQSRSVAMLNQVGGAIFAVAQYACPVVFFHGQKVKKILSFKTKEESIKIAQKMNKCSGINEHEADAMNLYNAYMLRIENEENEN